MSDPQSGPRHRVTFLVTDPFMRDYASDRHTIGYRETLVVDGNASVRSVAAEVAIRSGVDLSDLLTTETQDFAAALTVSVVGADRERPIDTVHVADESTIEYILDYDGRILFESYKQPFSHQYVTFAELSRLAELGYLRGRPDEILVSYRGGTGGDLVFVDIVTFLLDQGVDIGIEIARDLLIFGIARKLFAKFRNSRRDRKARQIATLWSLRGLEYPRQLREYIDVKESWTAVEVAGRLGIAIEAARQLLRALGLVEDARGRWAPGTSRKARKRRARWEAYEADAFYMASDVEEPGD